MFLNLAGDACDGFEFVICSLFAPADLFYAQFVLGALSDLFHELRNLLYYLVLHLK